MNGIKRPTTNWYKLVKKASNVSNYRMKASLFCSKWVQVSWSSLLSVLWSEKKVRHKPIRHCISLTQIFNREAHKLLRIGEMKLSAGSLLVYSCLAVALLAVPQVEAGCSPDRCTSQCATNKCSFGVCEKPYYSNFETCRCRTKPNCVQYGRNPNRPSSQYPPRGWLRLPGSNSIWHQLLSMYWTPTFQHQRCFIFSYSVQGLKLLHHQSMAFWGAGCGSWFSFRAILSAIQSDSTVCASLSPFFLVFI